MRYVFYAVLLLVIAGQALARLYPIDAAAHNKLPSSLPQTGGEQVGGASYLAVRHLNETPDALAQRLDAVVTGEPRTRRIAGDPTEGLTTYLTRTRVWGFPDIVTVGVFADGDGSRLVIFSRSVLARYDWEVNRKRVEHYLAALGSA